MDYKCMYIVLPRLPFDENIYTCLKRVQTHLPKMDLNNWFALHIFIRHLSSIRYKLSIWTKKLECFISSGSVLEFLWSLFANSQCVKKRWVWVLLSIFAAGDGRSKKRAATGWLSLLVTDLRQEQRRGGGERPGTSDTGLTLISFGGGR